MRILYIHATAVPPPVDPRTDRFLLLSKTLEGEVLHPVWFKSGAEVEALYGPGSYPVHVCGRFRYHWFLSFRRRGLAGRLAQFWFYVRKGVQLHRERPFDCIVAYSHMTTGIMAAVVKWITGAKLVIEVATSPDLVFITDRPRPTLADRLRKLHSDICLHLSLWSCDRAHLLYPAALARYPLLRRVKASVFHEYVPVATIPRHVEGTERFVLMVGAPWYLKGADRLIEAYRRLEPDFPGVKLKILGFFPDRRQLEELTGVSPQIEILKQVPNPEALELISRCTVLVQPSRCEGMGRTVLEAMGAGVPVIGSDTGGIPYILKDGECGFVVPGGDPAGLEARLRQLLSDQELRRQMGSRAYAWTHAELDERAYLERFTAMVEAAVRDSP